VLAERVLRVYQGVSAGRLVLVDSTEEKESMSAEPRR
jgi:hypothetical protein